MKQQVLQNELKLERFNKTNLIYTGHNQMRLRNKSESKTGNYQSHEKNYPKFINQDQPPSRSGSRIKSSQKSRRPISSQ